MKFKEHAKNRFSCRSFSEREVDREVLEEVGKIALTSPSARNEQPYKVYIFKGEEAIAELSKATNYTFGANAAYVVCYDKEKQAVRPFDDHEYGTTDASIFTTHLIYALDDYNLKSCWVGHFDPKILKEVLACPENIVPLAVLPVGYPAEGEKPSSRHDKNRSFEEVFEYYQAK